MKLQTLAGAVMLGAMITFTAGCGPSGSGPSGNGPSGNGPSGNGPSGNVAANPASEKTIEKSATSLAEPTEAQQQVKPTVAVLDAARFAEIIKEANIQLVDVRTAGEVASGKIVNAVNIDYNSVEFEALAAKLDPAKPVAVYCKVGGRSARAVKVFQQLGFTEIYELEGGIIAWNASRLPLEK